MVEGKHGQLVSTTPYCKSVRFQQSGGVGRKRREAPYAQFIVFFFLLCLFLFPPSTIKLSNLLLFHINPNILIHIF